MRCARARGVTRHAFYLHPFLLSPGVVTLLQQTADNEIITILINVVKGEILKARGTQQGARQKSQNMDVMVTL